MRRTQRLDMHRSTHLWLSCRTLAVNLRLSLQLKRSLQYYCSEAGPIKFLAVSLQLVQLPLKTWGSVNFNFILKVLWAMKSAVCRIFQKPWKWSTLNPYRKRILHFKTPEFMLSSSLDYALVPCQISWLYLNKQEYRSTSKFVVFQFDSPGLVENGKNLAFWPNQFLKPGVESTWVGLGSILVGLEVGNPRKRSLLGTFLHCFRTFLRFSL